ncbi:MAG: protein kinase [Kofleriaceae bacterium]|nr:protein kinase [Myxococcales bacterium]MCB9562115.1 protein kinase [Kofleriaceae bacterium]
MEEPLPGSTIVLTSSSATGLDHLSAVDLADLLLLALALRRAAAVSVAPGERRHEVRIDHGGTSFALVSLAPALGDAVVARLAILARLEVGAPHPQLGKLRVRLPGVAADSVAGHADLLVSVRPTGGGLAAEVHRIATLDESEPVVEVGEADDGAARVGKYRLLGELGRGGMGTVFRAEHVILQKPVALKVLHPGLAADPTLAAQFVLEARAACRARHPGIVDVTDFGRFPDGRAYIVMELVEAETLAQVLERGRLEPARALDIARQVAEALRAAAGHGVVHRDLKPGNIFVDATDRIKLADFGVARITNAAGATDRAVVGTTGYMAPEQTRGEVADARADLYALGCVLFEMLTGHVPFDGESPADQLARHAGAAGGWPSPAGLVPSALAPIIARATARVTDERYPSADAMLADLVRAAHELQPVGWRRWMT